MNKSDVGLVGLAVMGQNLALNIARNGYYISVYNRTEEKTKEFLHTITKDKDKIKGVFSLRELTVSLKRPRNIILMVKAGAAVDAVIAQLAPLMEKGDIIIDGGNSHFEDTIRRAKELKQKGIKFMGVGISGGEEGALKGPSIMPGGAKDAWDQICRIFTDISAKTPDGMSCCSYIGPNGAGHFVKMTHNGIEYSDMQLISEAYFLMKELLGMSTQQMKQIFAEWNEGELNSYLIEITVDILGKIDNETKKPLVDVILDSAGQKGTGKWTSQEALELGVAAPTIAEAVFARYMSANKQERVKASKTLTGPAISFKGNREQFIKDIEKALYASKICSYAQGFDLMAKASKSYNWNLNLGDIAMLWRGGCIIRAQFLDKINEAYKQNPELRNLLVAPYFKQSIENSQAAWRRVISVASLNGIPVPSFSSALAYYDSYRMHTLPANLIQAQRDYFGAHTYERIDREGIFHTIWV